MDKSLGRSQPSGGTLATLGKRAVAYLVLIAVAIVALKVVGAIVIGLFTTVITVALLVALAVAAIWAGRRL
jgi:uncharacterized membrane protein YphA (DoxX/SURF4 family)